MGTLPNTTILWCRSSTGKAFPVAQFSIATQKATYGFVSLTSIDKNEIVVAGLSASESSSNTSGLLSCEARVNSELGRADLRVNILMRAQAPSPAGTGSFSLKHLGQLYQPPILFYRDILAGFGEARVFREETESAFRASGGQLVLWKV